MICAPFNLITRGDIDVRIVVTDLLSFTGLVIEVT